MAGRLMRLLASGLILNATFPLDAWAATAADVVGSSPDSPLEGTGFELLVRGRGEAGSRAF
jgi:hypothetical protein